MGEFAESGITRTDIEEVGSIIVYNLAFGGDIGIPQRRREYSGYWPFQY